jgi:probable F420-dependent oxidoreductase
VWGPATWLDPARSAAVVELAQQLEAAGLHRIWIGSGQTPGLAPAYREILGATERIPVASGILNLWINEPDRTAEAVAELERRFPGRFLLGIGNSHAPMVERTGQRYDRPYAATVQWLDRLDATAEPAAGPDRRLLAALGPRMLRLAAERSVGAHPYFTTPDHTRDARTILGPAPLLAPEIAVVLESDPAAARAIARNYTARYLQLPNYTNNLRRYGWDDDDFLDGGSDALVDSLIPWGDENAIVQGLWRHAEAGADELVVQVLPADPHVLPVSEFARLAPAFAETWATSGTAEEQR